MVEKPQLPVEKPLPAEMGKPTRAEEPSAKAQPLGPEREAAGRAAPLPSSPAQAGVPAPNSPVPASVERPPLAVEKPPPIEGLKPRIKQLLIDMLFLQNVEAAAIGDEDNLQETLGVDSVALFQVVAGLEEAFGIRIEDKDFDAEKFSTVAGIETVVQEKLAGNA